MSQQPPWDPYGQQPRRPSFTPDPQPYGQQSYPPQGPPPSYQGPYPPQPMKPYTFRALGGGRVTIQDDAIVMSPVLKNLTFKRIRWARAEVAAVPVQPLPRKRCEVSVTRRDGTMRRYRGIPAAAAEVELAFVVRGYPRPL